jgi:hypothetical protein
VSINQIYTLFTRFSKFAATFYKFLGQKIFLCLKKREAELLGGEKKEETDPRILMGDDDGGEMGEEPEPEEETYEEAVFGRWAVLGGARGGAGNFRQLNTSGYLSTNEDYDTEEKGGGTAEDPTAGYSHTFRPLLFSNKPEKIERPRAIFSQLTRLEGGEPLGRSMSEDGLGSGGGDMGFLPRAPSAPGSQSTLFSGHAPGIPAPGIPTAGSPSPLPVCVSLSSLLPPSYLGLYPPFFLSYLPSCTFFLSSLPSSPSFYLLLLISSAHALGAYPNQDGDGWRRGIIKG